MLVQKFQNELIVLFHEALTRLLNRLKNTLKAFVNFKISKKVCKVMIFDVYYMYILKVY